MNDPLPPPPPPPPPPPQTSPPTSPVPPAVTPPVTPVALDPAALARLRELDPDGRHGVLQRVLNAFETSLVRMHAQVSAEMPSPDAEMLKSVAHTLKASSAAVGALSLARFCTDLERGLREGSITDYPPQAQRLLDEAEAALGAVAAMLRP